MWPNRLTDYGGYWPQEESQYRPIHGWRMAQGRPHMQAYPQDIQLMWGVRPSVYPTPYAGGMGRHDFAHIRPQFNRIKQHQQITPPKVTLFTNPPKVMPYNGPAPKRPMGISGPTDPQPTNSHQWTKALDELKKLTNPQPSTQIFGTNFVDFSGAKEENVIDLELVTKVKSCKADVTWKIPYGFFKGSQSYAMEAVIEGGMKPQRIQLPVWKSSLSIKLIPGTWYQVKITILDDGKIFARGNCSFKAIFDMNEMKEMYSKAIKHFGEKVGYRFQVMHRAKPQEYWDDIWYHRKRLMQKYDKDKNGQPGSPINGAIKGLFFSANLKNGLLPETSFFGELRMTIPAVQLFPLSNNLYFADFYCNKASHYVTVVITVPGTETDVYCKKCLIPLPLDNNPFVKVFQGPNGIEYWVHNNNLWVEIFYTEDIPLHWGEFSPVQPAGPGRSKPGGLANNKFCTTCNLYPLGVMQAEAKRSKPRSRSASRSKSRSRSRSRSRSKSRDRTELREKLKKLDQVITVDLTGEDEIEEYTLKDDRDITPPLPKETPRKLPDEEMVPNKYIPQARPQTSKPMVEVVDIGSDCQSEPDEEMDRVVKLQLQLLKEEEDEEIVADVIDKLKNRVVNQIEKGNEETLGNTGNFGKEKVAIEQREMCSDSNVDIVLEGEEDAEIEIIETSSFKTKELEKDLQPMVAIEEGEKCSSPNVHKVLQRQIENDVAEASYSHMESNISEAKRPNRAKKTVTNNRGLKRKLESESSAGENTMKEVEIVDIPSSPSPKKIMPSVPANALPSPIKSLPIPSFSASPIVKSPTKPAKRTSTPRYFES